MSIRRAESSDAKGIAKVHITAWQSAYRGILPDSFLDNLSVERSQSGWERMLADSSGWVLVFEQNGEIIGFAALRVSHDQDVENKKEGEIGAIYLLPHEWRKGYGKQLIHAAIAALREQGFTEVTLWVLRENQRAIEFYKKLGFCADGATKVDVRPNGIEFHEVRFRLSM